jgi:hypothetical protein
MTGQALKAGGVVSRVDAHAGQEQQGIGAGAADLDGHFPAMELEVFDSRHPPCYSASPAPANVADDSSG